MIIKKINNSLNKFALRLKGKTVLTEAATGNYTVTSVIAALGGAKAYALARNSAYGSIDEVRRQTNRLAQIAGVVEKITIIESFKDIDLKKIDILTNTGFLRPITEKIIQKLSPHCVIPLMWEPWEYRGEDLDIEACHKYGIKVYGTNESDERLRTKDYIGMTVLYLLLNNKLSPFSARILLIGCNHFVSPVEAILNRNHYNVSKATDYTYPVNTNDIDAIIILEHERDILIVGGDTAFIPVNNIGPNILVIHICGRVSFNDAKFRYIPDKPKPFGHMSYTADFIDNQAVIDLHTAGLKVAEGMLEANRAGLKGLEYKMFVENKYPGLAFDNPKFW